MPNHLMLDGAPLDADDLIKADVYGADDVKVGHITHIHKNDDGDLVVVDVGGFLGFGSKRVAIEGRLVTFVRDEEGVVFATTSFTKEQARDLPEHTD